MAHGAVRASTEAASILREVWDSQFALDPTEEAVVAPLVAKPLGVSKIGKKLHLRKILSQAAQKLTPSSHTTSLASDNLTYNQNTEPEITVTPFVYYAGIELNRDAMNEIIDDGEAIAGWRKQMLNVLDEKLDYELLLLAASASLTVAGADIDETMWTTGLATLAKNAKRKFKIGRTPYNLILHPDELQNALRIPALKEYQIRGSQGSAESGSLVTTFGATIEETGLVYQTGGVAAMPMMIKDAWALGFNEQPHILEAQVDGLLTRFIAYLEAGCSEWFDSSIVVLNCNI